MELDPLPRTPAEFRAILYRNLASAAWREDLGDNLDVTYPAWSARLEPAEAAAAQRRFAQFVADSESPLFSAYALLEDDPSRILLLALLLFRMLGHRKIALPTNGAAFHEAVAGAGRLAAEASDWNQTEGGTSLLRFRLDHGGGRLTLDCARANMLFTFFLRQYYLRRGPIRVEPVEGDTVIDAGACLGDTALSFAAAVGAGGHVHSFEPGALNHRILRANLDQNPRFRNLTVHECALGNADLAGPVAGGDCVDPGFRAAPGALMRTIDGLAASGVIERVDFIKMDIEGSELDALHGAAETIRRHRPKLAISLYHKPEDLHQIPLFIDSLGAGYSFHLENYTISEGETVLYCTTEDRRRADAERAS